MVKYLFLDVHGVLTKKGSDLFIGEAFAELKRIFDETGCHIILTSGWRRQQDHVMAMNSVFKAYGIRTLSGVTGRDKGRSELIRDYVGMFPRTLVAWAVLDDIADLNFIRDLDGHLVSTNPNEGLTERVADIVIKILNENDEPKITLE